MSKARRKDNPSATERPRAVTTARAGTKKSSKRRDGRTLLFTGKGGVGKTTVAAATALRCAEQGARTVVLSTDPAHSLADSFGTDLGSHPTPIVDNLWGQQLDTRERMEEAWGDLQAWLVDVFEWAGVDGIEAEELSLLPGLEEVFGLVDIKSYAESGEWDVLVVDCAPTAETIRLLSLPDVLRWYMERVFPTSRRLHKAVGPVLSRVTSLPIAGDAVFGSAERFYARLDGVKEVLADTERTSVRLVVNPERMVIAEARRTATYLALFGYGVDAVIANRLLPDGIADPWFARWKALHAEHLSAIEDGFAPLPVLRVELADTEVVGLDRLRALGDQLYADVDPATILHEGDTLRIVPVGADLELQLDLPFADRDEVDLGRHEDELLVTVGPYRRALMLPDSLRGRTVTGAHLRDGRLRVTFASPPRGSDGDGAAMTPKDSGAGRPDRDHDREVDEPDLDDEDDLDDDRSSDGDDRSQVPPGVDALQAAAREAINATRALLDVAEALVSDPDTAERVGSVIRAATGAAARAAAAGTAAGRQGDEGDDDDGSDGVQRIPVD